MYCFPSIPKKVLLLTIFLTFSFLRKYRTCVIDVIVFLLRKWPSSNWRERLDFLMIDHKLPHNSCPYRKRELSWFATSHPPTDFHVRGHSILLILHADMWQLHWAKCNSVFPMYYSPMFWPIEFSFSVLM